MLALLGALGNDAAVRGKVDDAERMYAEASAIARGLGDQVTDWGALNGLGALASGLGHLAEAERWFERANAQARAAGDETKAVRSETNLGFVLARMGNTDAARRIHEEWLQSTRASGASISLVVQLNALGQLALWAGDLESAAQYLGEARQVLEQIGGTDVAGGVDGNLAILRGMEAMRGGDRAGAADAFEEALRLFETALLPGVDQRPFVRQLLAELRERPASELPSASSLAVEPIITEPAAAESVVAEPVISSAATARRERRRWWPWGRKGAST